MFQNEVRKVLPTLNTILKIIETAVTTRKTLESIIPSII